MVQKYLPKACNKVGANISLKPENKQAIKKPSLECHDSKSKLADLKVIKMKKSRSVKKSNVEAAHLAQPKNRLPWVSVTPTKTPSPTKVSPNKPLYTSPNYMKSTSSSEARKETITRLSSIKTTTLNLHKVAKTSAKSTNLKKIRTLTKAPTFKHTRSTTCKKVVFNNLDVQRATCSSTLKDSKFPDYLKLNPGATEGEGNSESKVCPYTYCSLNGHHHASIPPLKSFLSSRRRIMKSFKFRPEILSPREGKPSKCLETEGKEDRNEGFFVEVFVSGKQVDTEISQSSSESEFQDNLDHYDQNETNFDHYKSPLVQKKLSFENDEENNSISSVSLDEFFGENSDMDWEEGHSPCVQIDYSEYNQDKLGFELNKSGSGKLEFVGDGYTQQFHDEIVECLDFTDIDISDSESTQIGEKLIDELVNFTDHTLSEENEITDLPNEATESLEDNYTDKHSTTFSNPLEEITESQDEELDSYKILEEIDGEEADNRVIQCSAYSEQEFDSSKVKLHCNKMSVVEKNSSEIQDHQMTEERNEPSQHFIVISDSNKESDSNPNPLETCHKLKRSMRGKKEQTVIKEEKEFNPRGPNFLPIELEPGPEKVNLRHQEIDERRNANEWMVDYALRKTVNQLAPARKRKVALLVEAFESVLPIPKFENPVRRNISGFAHSNPVQACR